MLSGLEHSPWATPGSMERTLVQVSGTQSFLGELAGGGILYFLVRRQAT